MVLYAIVSDETAALFVPGSRFYELQSCEPTRRREDAPRIPVTTNESFLKNP